MLEVKLWSLEGEMADSVFKGTLLYRNGKLRGIPAKRDDADLIGFTIHESIVVPVRTGDEVELVMIDPKTEPERWILNLHKGLRSYCLTAERAVAKPD